MSLPIFQTDNRDLSLMQTQWSSMINPMLKNPFLLGHCLFDIEISIGENIIGHGLGRKLQGWVLAGIDAPAVIYSTQSENRIPERTLLLTSDADCTISLYVF